MRFQYKSIVSGLSLSQFRRVEWLSSQNSFDFLENMFLRCVQETFLQQIHRFWALWESVSQVSVSHISSVDSQKPLSRPLDFFTWLIRLKSGEPIRFHLHHRRLVWQPCGWRRFHPLHWTTAAVVVSPFDYTRALGQTRALNMASSRSAVFSMTAELIMIFFSLYLVYFGTPDQTMISRLVISLPVCHAAYADWNTCIQFSLLYTGFIHCSISYDYIEIRCKWINNCLGLHVCVCVLVPLGRLCLPPGICLHCVTMFVCFKNR